METVSINPYFYRPCIFPILDSLNYGTAPTINNGLTSGPFVTRFAVSLSVFNETGELVKTVDKITYLEPGEVKKIDTRLYLDKLGLDHFQNSLGMLSLIPEKYFGLENVHVNRSELESHVQSSDDFIEFRQEPKGVITGVAYQVGQQNDLQFSKTRKTLVQAPKVIIGENVDTLLALMNVSTNFGYEDTAVFNFCLLDSDGSVIAEGTIDVPSWTYRLISIHNMLNKRGILAEFTKRGGLGMIVGSCENAGLIPISMTRNLKTGAIACDHSLPPVYYVSTWSGKSRINAHERLVNRFFREKL